MRIGFVGAGRMGWPMAVRLRDAGHEVCVLARTDEAAARAKQAGFHSANFIAGVVMDAELVIVCVFTDAQVREVCLSGGGIVDSLAPGGIIITHTTGSPTTVADIASRATEAGLGVLDAPVSGGPPQIEAGAITLFVGGDAEVFARAAPVLGCYGSPVLHVGALGDGQRVKLINNSLFAANIGLVAEAVGLGESLGLDGPTLLEALTHGSGTSRAGAMIAGLGSVEQFATSVGEFVSKDVKVARAVAADIGADLGLIGAVLASELVQERLLGSSPV
jgi:3-hydroxyisobutyrate dehydrogenase-like beta-hydroxyacid dehydrogenase